MSVRPYERRDLKKVESW